MESGFSYSALEPLSSSLIRETVSLHLGEGKTPSRLGSGFLLPQIQATSTAKTGYFWDLRGTLG